MTHNIFKALYNGEFNPSERSPHRTKEHQDIEDRIATEKRLLMAQMSDDDRRLLEQLESLYVDSHDLDQQEVFAYGFKLATLLMCAVFMSSDEPMSKI